jgi:hypothetical protein
MRWIFAIFMIGTGIYLLRGNSSRHVAIRRLTFLLFIILGIVSLLFADYWTKVSQFLGVENGTALLTYLVTFAFISNVISNYRWRRFIEQQIVELAREIALKSKHQND